jgi:hypothetical protein
MTIFDIAFMGLLTLNSFYVWGLLENKNKVKKSLEDTANFKINYRDTQADQKNLLRSLQEELVNITKYVADIEIEIIELKQDHIDIEKEVAQRNIPMEKGLC